MGVVLWSLLEHLRLDCVWLCNCPWSPLDFVFLFKLNSPMYVSRHVLLCFEVNFTQIFCFDLWFALLGLRFMCDFWGCDVRPWRFWHHGQIEVGGADLLRGFLWVSYAEFVVFYYWWIKRCFRTSKHSMICLVRVLNLIVK